jgi:GTP cyclohydrolase FolE2
MTMSASPAPTLLADRRAALPDVQATAPEHAIALAQVGVVGMRLPLALEHGPVVATLRLSVDLPATQRGAHMSRFRRAIDAIPAGLDAQGFARALAAELLRRHSYASSAMVEVTTDAVLGDLVLPLTARVIAGERPGAVLVGGSSLSLQLQGSTVCPCAYAMSGNRYAHVQRAQLDLQIFDARLSVAELHAICSRAFSAPVAMVLDRPAEKALVDRMFAHPRFVEDVAREAVNGLRSARAGEGARVVATAFESIHPYDCFATWEGSF